MRLVWLLIAIALLPTVFGLTQVNSCQDLVIPNETYSIAQDLSSVDATCLSVLADNITILGNGHTVSATSEFGAVRAVMVSSDNVVTTDVILAGDNGYFQNGGSGHLQDVVIHAATSVGQRSSGYTSVNQSQLNGVVSMTIGDITDTAIDPVGADVDCQVLMNNVTDGNGRAFATLPAGGTVDGEYAYMTTCGPVTVQDSVIEVLHMEENASTIQNSTINLLRMGAGGNLTVTSSTIGELLSPGTDITMSESTFEHLNGIGELIIEAGDITVDFGFVGVDQLGDEIRINGDTAYIASGSSLDVPAQITIRNAAYSPTMLILRNGFPCSDCTNTTPINASTVSFNVSGWSEYSVGHPSACAGSYSETGDDHQDGLLKPGDVFLYECYLPAAVGEEEAIDILVQYANSDLRATVFTPRVIFGSEVALFI